MALGNYGTQRGGQGEAVILNPQGFYNQVLAQDRYKRQQAAVNDRIAAKQKADQDKAKKEELYKMSAQTGGLSRYLGPYAAEARRKLNERTLKSIEKGEPINENALRLEYNALDAFEKQGLATGEDIDRRMVDLKETEFIKPSAFADAYRENLDDAMKEHLAQGKPISSFIVDNNDLIKKSRADVRHDIYDLTAINKKIKELYPNRRIEQPRVPGKTTGITTASPLYKTDPKTGLATSEIDFDKVAEAFNNPTFANPVNQSFARELTNADSPYFIENSKLKQQFANDPQGYANAQEALKSDFVKNELSKRTFLTSDALLRDPSSVATARPSGGGKGKQKEVIVGEGVFTNIKGMGRSTPIKDKTPLPDQQLLTYPVLTSTSKSVTKPTLLDAPAVDAINVGEDQIVKYNKIPRQSQVDIANPDYTVMPVLTKDIKVTDFIDKDGKKQTKPKIFKAGSVIGQGDEFSSQNRSIIKKIVEAAKRSNGLEYKFGALLPTYERQSKGPSESEIKTAMKAGISKEELEDTYGSQKLGLFRGNYFFPRDFTKGSIFSKSWGLSKNLYKGMTLEQIERDLRKQAIETLDSELGISNSKFADIVKSAQQKAPVQNKKALDD